MDYREKNFREKFKSASEYLKCKPDEIISIKLRGIVNDHDYYRMLLDFLKRNNKIAIQELHGNFQGNAFIIPFDKSKIIYIEHETGLEILYIAGSIASLVSLVPAILQIWKMIISKNNRHGREPYDRIEKIGRAH